LFAVIAGGLVWALLLDGLSRATVGRTLLLGLCAAALAVPAGWLIWRAGAGNRRWARLVVAGTMVAAALPPWAMVCGWDAAFGKLGWLTALATGRFTPLLPPFLAAVWIHAVIAAPQVALILHWFQAGDGWELEEQASLAVPLREVLFRVTLPRQLPGLLAGAAWTFLSASREIGVTDIYQIGTLAELVYLGYAQGANDTLSGLWPGGRIALGWPLYLLVLGGLVVVAAQLLVRMQRRMASRPPVHRRGWIALDRVPWPAMIVTWTLFAIPLANLLFRCGLRTVPGPEGPHQEWTLNHVVKAFSLATAESLPEWRWSLAIAITGATLLLALAVAGAALARRNAVVGWLVLASVVVAGSMPGPLVGRTLAWFGTLLAQPGLVWLWDRTILGPVVASSIYCWPVAIIVGWVLVGAVPEALHEQALLNGCTGLRKFWLLTVRLNATGWCGLWVVLVALVFGELSASHLVRPSGIDILPRLALGKMHSGIDEVAAAIGLSAAVAIGLCALAGTALFHHWSATCGRERT
jgi:ABC-type Fe3+ transport system permease subunit